LAKAFSVGFRPLPQTTPYCRLTHSRFPLYALEMRTQHGRDNAAGCPEALNRVEFDREGDAGGDVTLDVGRDVVIHRRRRRDNSRGDFPDRSPLEGFWIAVVEREQRYRTDEGIERRAGIKSILDTCERRALSAAGPLIADKGRRCMGTASPCCTKPH